MLTEHEEQPQVEASSGHRLVFSAHARRSGNAACDFPVSRYLCLNECGSFSSALSLEDSLSSAFPSRIPHTFYFLASTGISCPGGREEVVFFFSCVFRVSEECPLHSAFSFLRGSNLRKCPLDSSGSSGAARQVKAGRSVSRCAPLPEPRCVLGTEAAKMAAESGVRGGRTRTLPAKP